MTFSDYFPAQFFRIFLKEQISAAFARLLLKPDFDCSNWKLNQKNAKIAKMKIPEIPVIELDWSWRLVKSVKSESLSFKGKKNSTIIYIKKIRENIRTKFSNFQVYFPKLKFSLLVMWASLFNTWSGSGMLIRLRFRNKMSYLLIQSVDQNQAIVPINSISTFTFWKHLW